MTLTGIEFKRLVDAFKLGGVLAINAVLAAFAYATVIRGPLWPVGRLVLLRSSNEVLEHEGIYNPRAQRMFSWYALGCLAIGGIFLWLGWQYAQREFYLGTVVFWATFIYVTYAVFEWGIWRSLRHIGGILKEVGAWFSILGPLLLLCIVGLLSGKDLENSDYE